MSEKTQDEFDKSHLIELVIIALQIIYQNNLKNGYVPLSEIIELIDNINKYDVDTK